MKSKTLLLGPLASALLVILAACQPAFRWVSPEGSLGLSNPNAPGPTGITFSARLDSFQAYPDFTSITGGSFTSVIDFSMSGSSVSPRQVQVVVTTVGGQEAVSGNIPSSPGEPRMQYRARCGDASCSRIDAMITFSFDLQDGSVGDMRVLAIQYSTTTNQQQSALLNYDGLSDINSVMAALQLALQAP